MDVRAERRIGGAEVVVVHGDITTVEVDAVVNAANEHLQHGGGVAAAIARAGGPVVVDESDDWVRAHGPLRNGRAAVTTAGRMPADHVIHVVGPRYLPGQDNEGMLHAAIVAALAAAVAGGDDSVAVPAVSAGIFGYPPEQATEIIVGAVTNFLRIHGAPARVLLVAHDEAVVGDFVAALPTAG